MIGPFRRRTLALILGCAAALGLLLSLASISVPTSTVGKPSAEATRYVTDPNAAGPLVGSTFSIPLNQPLAVGGTWGDLVGANAGDRLVIIDFFATWCPPCQGETPILRSFDRAYRSRGLRIIGIAVNESADTVAAYGRRYTLDYALLVDADGALFRAAQAGGLPTKILLDAAGRVIAVLPRPLTAADGAELIEPLLADAP